MTPHKAINSLRKSGITLEEIKKMLAKKKVVTSVSTLWRILESPKHETSMKLGTALIELHTQVQEEKQK